MTFEWLLPDDRFFLLARVGIVLAAAVAAVALLAMKSPGRDSTRFALIALSPSFLAFVLLLPVIFLEIVAFTSNPVALDYNEGGLMTHVAEALAGGALYSEFGKPPYEINNYGPVFFYLTAAIVRVFDLEILAAIRALSAVAVLGCAVLVCPIVFAALPDRMRRSHRMIAAVVAALIFLTSATLLRAIGRLDMVATFFSLVGMLSILRTAKRPAWFAVAALAFLAAGFTKQTAVAGFIASVSVLFYVAPRTAIKFALVVTALAAVIFAALQVATDGGFFTHIIWANASQPFDPRRLISKVRGFLLSHAVGVVLAVFGSVMAFRSADETSREAALKRLMPVAYGAFAMLSTFTVGKAAAASNHFLEATLALSMLAAIGIGYGADYLERDWDRLGSRRRTAGAIVLAFALFQGWTSLARHANNRVALFLNRSTQEIAETAEIVRLVRNAQGPVIAEDRSYLVLAGKHVFYEMNDMRLLAMTGKFSEEPAIDCLRNGPCALVVLEQGSHDFVQTIARGEVAGDGIWTMGREMGSVLASRFRLVWSSPKKYVYDRIPAVDPQ